MSRTCQDSIVGYLLNQAIEFIGIEWERERERERETI